MTNISSRKKAWPFCLICILLLIPLGASAGVGDIISLLTTITDTLKNGVGQVLSGIQTINTTITNLEQQVVWPVELINQTKASVGQVRAQFSSLAEQVHSIQANSATLVNPAHLESLLRGGQASNLNQIGASYAQVYLPLPEANKATSTQRNLIDADDALALEGMKTATTSDQASKTMLNVADGLEQEAAASAPGSASILSAQAQVANLQGQAMLQKMLAADLRQHAAKMAHANALRKQSAEATRDLRNDMQQILSRP
jgi:hypothetical protein